MGRKKGNRVFKKSLKEIDSVGWGFWGIVFVLSLPPCIWVCWKMKAPAVAALIPIGFGVVLAMAVAAFISWPVNMLLQWRDERRRKTARKKTKKKKKKK
jgi:hypothetical protein